GDNLHSWCRSQFAGTLDCSDTRGAREGPAGRSLSRNSRHAGFGWCQRSQEEPFEIRRQASEGRREIDCEMRIANLGVSRSRSNPQSEVSNPKSRKLCRDEESQRDAQFCSTLFTEVTW